MESLQRTQHKTQRKITFTVDSGQASDLLTGLHMLSNYRVGEPSQRCKRLADQLWVQAFHNLARDKAA